MNNNNTTYFTDTTFICNKLGEDLISNNPQIKKHLVPKGRIRPFRAIKHLVTKGHIHPFRAIKYQ